MPVFVAIVATVRTCAYRIHVRCCIGVCIAFTSLYDTNRVFVSLILEKTRLDGTPGYFTRSVSRVELISGFIKLKEACSTSSPYFLV
jgi:hypothetical protein